MVGCVCFWGRMVGKIIVFRRVLRISWGWGDLLIWEGLKDFDGGSRCGASVV